MGELAGSQKRYGPDGEKGLGAVLICVQGKLFIGA